MRESATKRRGRTCYQNVILNANMFIILSQSCVQNMNSGERANIKGSVGEATIFLEKGAQKYKKVGKNYSN